MRSTPTGTKKLTSAEWIGWNKQVAKKGGWDFNEEKALANFEDRDTDEDGHLRMKRPPGSARSTKQPT